MGSPPPARTGRSACGTGRALGVRGGRPPFDDSPVPDGTLRLYAGKGHAQTLSDHRMPEDMLDFIDRHPKSETETRASEGASQAVAAKF